MVHAVHRSIQVYQDFHRQTLNHLQMLEQESYKLMPQFDRNQIVSMVKRAHQMKAGARFLNLQGYERLAHLLKGRYIALTRLTLTFDRDLLQQMIQMQEIFRLGLLSQVSTWQDDLNHILGKLPDIFGSLDRNLEVHAEFSQPLPSRACLERDVQRLLTAIVLTPELARLDMMLKNTPASKLADILISQLPRLQALAQNLQLQEIQRSMQSTILEVQAQPQNAKTIGQTALLKWSDACLHSLTQDTPNPKPPSLQTQSLQGTATTFENRLTALSVALLEGANSSQLGDALRRQSEAIAALAQSEQMPRLEQMTKILQRALHYHPDKASLLGRLAVQDWLWYQVEALTPNHPLEPASKPDESSLYVCETLLELAQPPETWPDQTPKVLDPMTLNHLSQVALPDGFTEDPHTPASPDEDPDNLCNNESLLPLIGVSRKQLQRLSALTQTCQIEIEQLPSLAPPAHQAFKGLLNQIHDLLTLPLGSIFQQLQTMVDALGLQFYKDVKFLVAGENLLIDRLQAESLYEMLVPLVANAIIHGIETVENRRQAGKRLQGSLSISAYSQGQTLLIDLRDDGQGLDFKALRKWVGHHYELSDREMQRLTEKQLMGYLFRSKKNAKSDSESWIETGFGAVQRYLSHMGGSIELTTLSRQGTTCRIKLPNLIRTKSTLNVPVQQQKPAASSVETQSTSLQTLNSRQVASEYSLEFLRHQAQQGPLLRLETQGLFIWADSISVFVLECDRIEEYVMPQITEAHESETSLYWRDQWVSIYTLQDFLGHNDSETESADGGDRQSDVILMLKGESQFLALRAPMHHLVTQAVLEINPLSQAIAAPRYIYGVTELEQDHPVLVIDVTALIAQQPLQSATLPLPNPTDDASNGSTDEDAVKVDALEKILVVDDSRTAREIVAMTLRQGGYEVLLAKDGQEALDLLLNQAQSHALVNLMISDVAMPRMNGLELLRRCRQEEALRSIPIAMLSNCDSTTHRDLAIQAGANAYLTKPYQEAEFLSDIATLLAAQPQAVAGT